MKCLLRIHNLVIPPLNEKDRLLYLFDLFVTFSALCMGACKVPPCFVGINAAVFWNVCVSPCFIYNYCSVFFCILRITFEDRLCFFVNLVIRGFAPPFVPSSLYRIGHGIWGSKYHNPFYMIIFFCTPHGYISQSYCPPEAVTRYNNILKSLLQ